MSEIVQAKCPHCQTALRIPADWLSEQMRCKHCKKIFQAKSTGSSKFAAPAKTSVAVAVGAPPTHTPFSLGQDDAPAPSSPGRRGRSQGGPMILVALFFVLFLLGVAGASFVVYKAVTMTPPEKGPYVASDAPPKKDAGSDAGAANDKSSDNVKPPPNDKGGKKDKKIVVPPRKDSKDQPKTDGVKPPPSGLELFPRRALLISVNSYLMFNPVLYGSAQDSAYAGYPGSSTAALRDRFTRAPMNFPISQVYELSDGIPAGEKIKPHSTQRSVIESTIKDFLDTSRDQDRVVVFFAGHGAYVEEQKQSYLVPIDGNLKNLESLVPLKWVLDQMAKCRAQQKVLVLDVFRYSPSRGFEYPSPGIGDDGAMPEEFDKDLQNPPPGVQVWASCIKEQSAVELEGGSAFMQAFCAAMLERDEAAGITEPSQPIPIETYVVKVNQKLGDLTKSVKKEQTSRLTGKSPGTVVAYNAAEPLPPKFDLKPPTVQGQKAAAPADVNSILDEIRRLAVVRETRVGDNNLLKAQNLPAFPMDQLASYKLDGYKDINDLHERYKKAVVAAESAKAEIDDFSKEFPLRGAYFAAVDALNKSSKLQMREVLRSPINPKDKVLFLAEQKPIAESIFHLKGALATMKEAEKERDKETSKRWHANFDYTQARLRSRLIYLFEYNYIIGQIRNDNVPELAPGQNGWRIGTGKKIAVTEPEAKNYFKETKKLWERIQNDYPDTPWALLAQRESLVSIGLSWRPKSD